MTHLPFALELPINSTSFGQTSTALLREAAKSQLSPSLFTIGAVDLSSQPQDNDFNQWLQKTIISSQVKASRSNPSIKLWHISGALSTYSSSESRLITFHETDSLTPTEENILKNQDLVHVTSSYTKKVFENHGVKNVKLIKLGVDKTNFPILPKKERINGEISFLLAGKAEKRKSTYRQLNLWAKRYGNDKRYKLNVSVTNPFLKPEDQNALLSEALENKRYWNINFLNWSRTNMEYNQVLQSSDIHLACSLCEGFDLPAYHSTALGVLPVALNAHVFPDYLNSSNSVLIEPSGMIEALDGIFFKKNQPFNQGYWHTFSDEAFYAGCDKAIQRVSSSDWKGNVEGKKLYERDFSHVLGDLIEDFVIYV